MKNKPIVSIIIPVYKEKHSIDGFLNGIPYDKKLFDYEVFIIDGSPDKCTISFLMNKNVTKLFSSPGRAVQMNTGAEAASGDIFLFLHADTILPANVFEKIFEFYKSDKYVAGAFDLKIAGKGLGYRLIEFMACRRTRISRVPFGDQAIFIRKDYFNKIGRYKEIPLMEDVELMKRIRRRKEKIIIFKDKVLTSPRKWEKDGMFFTTIRNWILQFLFALGVSPENLVKFYYKHLQRLNR